MNKGPSESIGCMYPIIWPNDVPSYLKHETKSYIGWTFLHNNDFWCLWNIMYQYMKILWKMEHLLFENIMENGAFALWKYYGKWSICSFGANAPFSIIFSKVFKTYLKFFLTFSMLSKNRKWCHDLKIAYEVNGWSMKNYPTCKELYRMNMVLIYQQKEVSKTFC